MKKLLTASVLAFALAACMPMFSAPVWPVYDASQKAYVARARTSPLSFKVPKADAAAAWGRVQYFVGTYASMKIQTATDYIVETYNPTSMYYFGYSAQRAPLGDSDQISLDVRMTGYGADSMVLHNARIMSHFVRTAEPIPNGIVWR
jgi:hypothetical protein